MTILQRLEEANKEWQSHYKEYDFDEAQFARDFLLSLNSQQATEQEYIRLCKAFGGKSAIRSCYLLDAFWSDNTIHVEEVFTVYFNPTTGEANVNKPYDAFTEKDFCITFDYRTLGLQWQALTLKNDTSNNYF